MSEPAPTFANNRDRVTYLIAEYRVPLSVVALALIVWLSAFSPSIPEPPEELLAGTAAAGLLAFPSFIAAKVVIGWFDTDQFVRIGVSAPGREPIHQVWNVPPAVWENVEVEEARPYPDVAGVDFVVTRFEWLEDIKQLRIRGVDRAEMQPSEAWASAERVDRYYGNYLETLRAYSSLKTRVGEKVTETHDATIMQLLGAREKSELAPGVSVTDLIKEIEQDGAEDELPDPLEFEDDLAPSLEDDAMGMGGEAVADGGNNE